MQKIAIITSHCIQYQAPLFRAIAKQPDIDLTVFFGSDHGLASDKVDPGFGKAFAWDIPLLDGYHHVFLKNSKPEYGVNDFMLDGPELKAYFRDGNYDAVVVFGWNNRLFLQAVWWARKFSVPLILRAESNLKHLQGWYVKVIKQLLFPVLFRKFRGFLAIGSHNAELYQHYGVPEEAIFMAPYCVDNDFFSGEASARLDSASQLRRNLSIKDTDTVFLYMAKFIERKRPLDLIKAAIESLDDDAGHVILVGDGVLMEKCSKEVTKNGIKNIHFSGFINQSELPTYYAAGDVLVLPSYYETWGLVLNEAMASGLPSIVSDGCGAAVDMIIDGKTGYTYPMGDIHQLGSLMKKFTGNKDLCKEMGLNAAEHVKKFSLEVTVSALKNSLNSVGER